MEITPDQIRAARALLRLEPHEVAARADVPLAAVHQAEGADAVTPAALAAVRTALEQAGAVFIADGVRKRPPMTAEQKALFDKLEAISKRSGEIAQGVEMLTDDDLYDENGLPA